MFIMNQNELDSIMILDRLHYSFENRGLSNCFCIQDTFYTYRDLSNKVASIMAQIRSQPKMNGSKRIAVYCTDSFSTYASLFAIWFLDKAYVPLGLHNPVERNLSILNEAKIDCIISTEKLEDIRYAQFEVVNPELAISICDKIHKTSVNQEDLAYILFTSGSTGLPKGVPISFRNLSSFVEALKSSSFTIDESDRCLQMFELTFDVSISSFLLPMISGACVYTVPTDGIRYVHVLKLIEKYNLTSIQIVPSIIRLATPILSRIIFPSVKNCILTGEATSVDLLSIWTKSVPNSAIFNFYGPTEATVYCSEYIIDSKEIKSYNNMLAIGRPLAGISFLIVDDSFNNVQYGEKGELLIAGNQVTKGYLNNYEKNISSFKELTIDGLKQKFYRSGDLCFQDEGGDYYYCGRLDNQVKIQGFRVELSEIEMSVRFGLNLNCIAVVESSNDGSLLLILVIEAENEIDQTRIRDHMKKNLPSYMVPSKIAKVNSFPLTSSGKTDRQAIKKIINGEFKC